MTPDATPTPNLPPQISISPEGNICSPVFGCPHDRATNAGNIRIKEDRVAEWANITFKNDRYVDKVLVILTADGLFKFPNSLTSDEMRMLIERMNIYFNKETK